LSADAISFTRSFTSPAHRGKGHAAELVEFAVDDVEKASTRRIVPMCWYVGQWFDDHPERADLLSR
jgi:predicted GNAT family acetyltransferase